LAAVLIALFVAAGSAASPAGAAPDAGATLGFQEAPITGDWWSEPHSFATLQREAPTLFREFFDRKDSYGWDLPQTRPLHTTLFHTYGSYAQFQEDLSSGHAPRSTWLMYDPERCCGSGPEFTVGEPIPSSPPPTPPEEQRNPVRYMPLFGSLAHAHDYSVIIAPALNLLTVPDGACTQSPGEDLFHAYLRCGYAAAAARNADAVDIQAQQYQCDTATYAAHVKAAASQARGAHGGVRIESGLSSGRCQPTGDQLFAAYQAVADVVDGHFIAVVEPTFQAAIDFLGRLAPIVVDGTGFSPTDDRTDQGSIVSWRVSWNAHEWHSVTDRSGMGLFDSGLQKPGTVLRYTFIGSGTYLATDVATGGSGTISMPARASPLTGTGATTFTVETSTRPAPTGFVFETQIVRPNGDWTAWRTGSVNTFIADAGTGRYGFRGRLRRKSNDAACDWSPPAWIQVTG
jgi:hypothetical protein